MSLKWQQTSGTAGQKAPFEVMCLADGVRAGHAVRAFLVLGGDGWKLCDYFTSDKLTQYLIHAALVRVVTLEAFIRLRTTDSSDRSGLHSTRSVFAGPPGPPTASRPAP